MDLRDAETGELLVLSVSPEKLASIESKSPSKSRHDDAFCAETQSTRKLGDSVAWQIQQLDKQEKAEKRSRNSIDGVRQELRRKDISAIVKRQLETELLERMRTQYCAQVQRMIVEEMQRELEREVQLRLEVSSVARERLRKRFDGERTLAKQQIERIRAECELSLTAAMAQHSFLR